MANSSQSTSNPLASIRCSFDLPPGSAAPTSPMLQGGQCVKLSEQGVLAFFAPFLVRAGQELVLRLSLPDAFVSEKVKIMRLYEKYADGYPQVVQKILLVDLRFVNLQSESRKKILQFLKSLELKSAG